MSVSAKGVTRDEDGNSRQTLFWGDACSRRKSFPWEGWLQVPALSGSVKTWEACTPTTSVYVGQNSLENRRKIIKLT